MRRLYVACLQLKCACFVRPQRYGLILYAFKLCANCLLSYAHFSGYRRNADPLHTIVKYKRGTFTE